MNPEWVTQNRPVINRVLTWAIRNHQTFWADCCFNALWSDNIVKTKRFIISSLLNECLTAILLLPPLKETKEAYKEILLEITERPKSTDGKYYTVFYKGFVSKEKPEFKVLKLIAGQTNYLPTVASFWPIDETLQPALEYLQRLTENGGNFIDYISAKAASILYAYRGVPRDIGDKIKEKQLPLPAIIFDYHDKLYMIAEFDGSFKYPSLMVDVLCVMEHELIKPKYKVKEGPYKDQFTKLITMAHLAHIPEVKKELKQVFMDPSAETPVFLGLLNTWKGIRERILEEFGLVVKNELAEFSDKLSGFSSKKLSKARK